MKKLLSVLFIIGFMLIPQTVQAKTYDFDDYQKILNELNSELGTDYALLDEQEFYTYEGYTELYGTYENYQNTITSLSIDEFKNYWVDMDTYVVIDEEEGNVPTIDTRSTQTSKTKYFNNDINKMKLTYYYTTKSGTRYFDTSKKPTVTVTKVGYVDYFVMSSHSGKYSNSNKTYTVTAKGTIYNIYGTRSATFSVAFTA